MDQRKYKVSHTVNHMCDIYGNKVCHLHLQKKPHIPFNNIWKIKADKYVKEKSVSNAFIFYCLFSLQPSHPGSHGSVSFKPTVFWLGLVSVWPTITLCLELVYIFYFFLNVQTIKDLSARLYFPSIKMLSYHNSTDSLIGFCTYHKSPFKININ